MKVLTQRNSPSLPKVMLAAVHRQKRLLLGVLSFYVLAAVVIAFLAHHVVMASSFGDFEQPNIFLAFRVIVLGGPALCGVLVGAVVLAQEFERGTYRFSFTQDATPRRWMIANVLVVLLANFAGLTVLGMATKIFLINDAKVREIPDWTIGGNFTQPLMVISLGVLVFAVATFLGAIFKKFIAALVASLFTALAFFAACYVWAFQRSMRFFTITHEAPYLSGPPRHALMISAMVHTPAGALNSPIWSPAVFAHNAQTHHWTFWITYVPASAHHQLLAAWCAVIALAAALLIALSILTSHRVR
jgi:ABC-type transport system involved in multi-copper enzyme maturation permease subunit